MNIVQDDEWALYPNFTRAELACKHTGFCEMTHKMMDVLQKLRSEYGKPIHITSGYRDVSHPVERSKSHPGEHTNGMAVDIAVYGVDALLVIKLAIDLGIKRVGVSQKGTLESRFIHLGVGNQGAAYPEGVWTY